MSDVSLTAASVALVSGNTKQGIAAEAVTAGQLVGENASGGVILTDTNGASAYIRTMKGVALCNAAAGQPITYALPGSVVNMGGTLTVGGLYCASATPGGLAPVADLATGHYTTVAGIAQTAANMLVVAANGGVARP